MKTGFRCLLLIVSGLLSLAATAQEEPHHMLKKPGGRPPVQRLYWSNGLDAAIFSTSLLQKTGQSDKLTTLRFSYVVNFGFNLNFDFNRHIGLMTGAGVKNIGFIEKTMGGTVKRRVYTLGVPLGIKIGDLARRNFVFLGGGLDAPVNYREKAFVDRGDKVKFNEWFSERTPSFMPYVFAGVSASPGVTFKLQYYPGNFLNRDFTTVMPDMPLYYKPYQAYEKVSLIMLSIGMDIHYKKHPRHDDGERERGRNATMEM